jgi:hypothetical protein
LIWSDGAISWRLYAIDWHAFSSKGYSRGNTRHLFCYGTTRASIASLLTGVMLDSGVGGRCPRGPSWEPRWLIGFSWLQFLVLPLMCSARMDNRAGCYFAPPATSDRASCEGGTATLPHLSPSSWRFRPGNPSPRGLGRADTAMTTFCWHEAKHF